MSNHIPFFNAHQLTDPAQNPMNKLLEADRIPMVQEVFSMLENDSECKCLETDPSLFYYLPVLFYSLLTPLSIKTIDILRNWLIRQQPLLDLPRQNFYTRCLFQQIPEMYGKRSKAPEEAFFESNRLIDSIITLTHESEIAYDQETWKAIFNGILKCVSNFRESNMPYFSVDEDLLKLFHMRFMTARLSDESLSQVLGFYFNLCVINRESILKWCELFREGVKDLIAGGEDREYSAHVVGYMVSTVKQFHFPNDDFSLKNKAMMISGCFNAAIEVLRRLSITENLCLSPVPGEQIVELFADWIFYEEIIDHPEIASEHLKDSFWLFSYCTFSEKSPWFTVFIDYLTMLLSALTIKPNNAVLAGFMMHSHDFVARKPLIAKTLIPYFCSAFESYVNENPYGEIAMRGIWVNLFSNLWTLAEGGDILRIAALVDRLAYVPPPINSKSDDPIYLLAAVSVLGGPVAFLRQLVSFNDFMESDTSMTHIRTPNFIMLIIGLIGAITPQSLDHTNFSQVMDMIMKWFEHFLLRKERSVVFLLAMIELSSFLTSRSFPLFLTHLIGALRGIVASLACEDINPLIDMLCYLLEQPKSMTYNKMGPTFTHFIIRDQILSIDEQKMPYTMQIRGVSGVTELSLDKKIFKKTPKGEENMRPNVLRWKDINYEQPPPFKEYSNCKQKELQHSLLGILLDYGVLSTTELLNCTSDKVEEFDVLCNKLDFYVSITCLTDQTKGIQWPPPNSQDYTNFKADIGNSIELNHSKFIFVEEPDSEILLLYNSTGYEVATMKNSNLNYKTIVVVSPVVGTPFYSMSIKKSIQQHFALPFSTDVSRIVNTQSLIKYLTILCFFYFGHVVYKRGDSSVSSIMAHRFIENLEKKKEFICNLARDKESIISLLPQ